MPKIANFPKIASIKWTLIFDLVKSKGITFYYLCRFVGYINIPFENGICLLAHQYVHKT